MKIKNFASLLLFSSPIHKKSIVKERVERVVSEWESTINLSNNEVPSNKGLVLHLTSMLYKPILISIGLVLVQALFALMSAFTLNDLILSLEAASAVDVVGLHATALIVTTFCSWLFLNFSFMGSEYVGLLARAYSERLLITSYFEQDDENKIKRGFESVVDKECSRIQFAFESIVLSVLVLTTLVYSVTFLSLVVGSTSLIIYLVISIAGFTIYKLSKKLEYYLRISSDTALSRVEIGQFLIKNRLSVMLNNWSKFVIDNYGLKRKEEEKVYKKTYLILISISVISSIVPTFSLLSLAFFQFVTSHNVDIVSLLSSAAVVGGLRSVANSIPDLIQNLKMGKVGMARLSELTDNSKYFAHSETLGVSEKFVHKALNGKVNPESKQLIDSIIDYMGSGALVSITDPWIFNGSVADNLRLYSPSATENELLQALRWVRLPDEILTYENNKVRRIEDKTELSRGQKKRLELARIILSDATNVVMFNPTAGLDETNSDGLLQDLLHGPLKRKNIIFISDKPEELKLSDVITLSDMESLFSLSECCQSENVNQRMYPVSYDIDLSDTRSSLTLSFMSKLENIGINKLILLILSVFLVKDLTNILLDYTLINHHWQSGDNIVFFACASLLVLSLLFSVMGNFYAVDKILGNATHFCKKFLSSSVYSNADKSKSIINVVGRMTREQRLFDEKLPFSMIEFVGACTILLSVFIYIGLQSVWVMVTVVPLLFALVWQNYAYGNYISQTISNEIDKATNLQQAISDIASIGDEGRSRYIKHKAKDWVYKSQNQKNFSSLYNVLTQRWFNIRIDFIGVAFFFITLCGIILVYINEGYSVGIVLTLSFTYSLISIFGRVSRTYIEFNQILESANLIATESSNTEEVKPRSLRHFHEVRFDNVTFYHDNSKKDLFIDLSFTVSKGQSLIITGESGSGKSTLVSLLAGILMPKSGEISVLGANTKHHDIASDSIFYASHDAVFKPGVIDNYYEDLDEKESVCTETPIIPITPLVVNAFKDIANGSFSWSGKLGLDKHNNQILAISLLEYKKYELIILDEALGVFDSDLSKSILHNIRKENEDAIIICITHNPELIPLGDVHLDLHELKLSREELSYVS
ncbi:hypothetical protein BCU17_14085 [Vibrio splendidus]|uniref:ABC transporter ATP-binding protein n=1 Tax=Vibrio splendidus TaxID=29497 RepID=A0A2N7FIR3_VIBSP|nr:ABC transporter ATP-binding protein [Vibrio splendidus]PMJ69188.1 hypothetical protein BCU17_14085 [Vibrio splendidus]